MTRTTEHVGEWQIAIAAGSREDVFTEVAAFVARAVSGRRARTATWESVTVDAPDLPGLLVNWANDLIGRAEAGELVYDATRAVSVQSTASGWRVEADVRARPVRGWRSPLKAATHHGVVIEQVGARWRAVLLLDV